MIEIQNVSKTFSNGFKALDNVSLKIGNAEFFALLGPSGCGKTSLLRMIAGFSYPDSGKIFIDGQEVTYTQAHKRPVNMVFQSYAVFPHMSVFDNIAYGLVVEKMPREKIKLIVSEMLHLVRLEGFENKMPDQLSGGQKQRVAVARALAKQPKALLLDEPLSALDAKLRDEMRSELINIQKKSNVTFLFVTHDQSEALSLSDRLAIMRHGQILQVGSPEALYERPRTSFIADFIGSTNLLKAEVKENLLNIVGIEDRKWPLEHQAGHNPITGDIFVALKPKKISLSVGEKPPDHLVSIPCEVEELTYLGDQTIANVKIQNGDRLKVVLSDNETKSLQEIQQTANCWCYWEKDSMQILSE